MKKFKLIMLVLALSLITVLIAGCIEPVDPIIIGLNSDGDGLYMSDSSVIIENNKRYVFYTTTDTAWEQSNAIALRIGELKEGGYSYTTKKIVLTASKDGWDSNNIGAPDVVKGIFNYGNVEYNYLMVYQANKFVTEKNFSVGFAVAKTLDGEWTKVGTKPIIEYNSEIYGEFNGFYAPSVVSNDKLSNLRVFYTWADAYGHFTYYSDIDCKNLDAIAKFGYAMLPTKGLSTGENVINFPNSDFAYNEATNTYYVIKDYSPVGAAKPKKAERLEVAKISGDEMLVAETKTGWQSIKIYDFTNTTDSKYERLFSGCIATDAYGRLIDNNMFIVYTVSQLESENPDYLYSARLMTFDLAL